MEVLLLIRVNPVPEVTHVTRRQAYGLLLVALLLAGGRLVRQHMLLTGDTAWRDQLWLDGLLPPLPEEVEEVLPLKLTAPVNINSCAPETLLALPGVGPVLAERILSLRADGVQFASPGELQMVKGIGPKLAARLAPHLCWPADTTLTSLPATSSRTDPHQP
jgi:competence protein ComEA